MKTFIYGSTIAKAVLLLVSITFLLIALVPNKVQASQDIVAKELQAAQPAPTNSNDGLKYIAAAIAVGLGSIAGGIAVAVVGSAALGTAAERPELMMRSMLFVGLAEGIAIYGTAIAAFMLL